MVRLSGRAKRLMMLGAGVCQVPGIRKAQQQGLEVVACSYRGDDPGMAIATYAENVDITDKEGILGVAQRYEADAIMTMCSDVGVCALGYVNDQLGLSGISEATALLCSNKHLMKQAFAHHGISTARFARIESLDEARAFFAESPGMVVLKAADSSGSRGVRRASDEAGVARAFTEAFRHTEEGFIIVEDAVEGEEFGSQALVLDGEVVCNLCHNDIVTSGEVTTPIGHSYPFRNGPEVEQRVLEELDKSVRALGLRNAQLNCDFILNESEVYVLEIGARMGGTSLPQLTEAHTGLDWVAMGIDLALGQLQRESLARVPPAARPTAAMVLRADRSGTVSQVVVPDWVESGPGVTYFVMEARVGQHVNKFRLGPDRLGEVLAVGDSLEEAEQIVERAVAEIRIEVM